MRAHGSRAFIDSASSFMCLLEGSRIKRLMRHAIPCTAAALLPVAGAAQSTAPRANPVAEYGRLPLSFEANQGQTDGEVKFLSSGSGYSLFLTDKEAVLSLSKARARRPRLQSTAPTAPPQGENVAKRDVVHMQLEGAAAGIRISGVDKLPGTTNYFIGNNPAKWQTSVPTYSKVRYEGVYPGVDLVYYGNQGRLEYDFVVAPHASPKPIRLRFAGAKRMKIDNNGDLEVFAKDGEITFHKPDTYQLKNGKQTRIVGSFTLTGRSEVGFRVGGYDRSGSLVIDPVLQYSTYLGGSGGNDGSFDDTGTGIAVDQSGNSYVVGYTWSTDFPVTSKSYDSTDPGVTDGFITSVGFISKLNADGSALIYSTYIGGNGSSSYDGNNLNVGGGDLINSLALDLSGNVYITGLSWSSDFPVTKGAYQSDNRAYPYGFDAFVSKINSLLYSTYLGGKGGAVSSDNNAHGDSANAIAIDALGNAYVAGFAYSTDFPTTKGAFQLTNKGAANNASDGFVH